jgi:hypothetical protein
MFIAQRLMRPLCIVKGHIKNVWLGWREQDRGFSDGGRGPYPRIPDSSALETDAISVFLNVSILAVSSTTC